MESNGIDLLKWQMIIAAVVSFAIEHLKQSRWFPFLSLSSARANAFAGVVVAVASSLGIHFEFNHAAGTLVITGLSLATIWHFGQDILTQWIFQQLVYKGAIR